MRPYFPGGELNTFASTLHNPREYATPSSQRLRPGLLGYLIRFAPLAFVPHRRIRSGLTPSPQVVLEGLLHFTAPPLIPQTPHRSLVWECPLHAVELSPTISQEIFQTGYGRFRPSNADRHLWRWCYRGGWHQSCPPLIRQGVYPWQKPEHCSSTQDSLITLSCIVKVPRLLHPVGLGPVSQCPSRGYLSQGPYGSKAW